MVEKLSLKFYEIKIQMWQNVFQILKRIIIIVLLLSFWQNFTSKQRLPNIGIN
jgi:hypothetical protein